MSARRIFAFSTISALVATLAMGCSSATTEEEEEVSVDDITPESAQTVWALAELCDGNITRHSAVKAQETAQGVVRWQCGDREGVDGEPLVERGGDRRGLGNPRCESQDPHQEPVHVHRGVPVVGAAERRVHAQVIGGPRLGAAHEQMVELVGIRPRHVGQRHPCERRRDRGVEARVPGGLAGGRTRAVQR